MISTNKNQWRAILIANAVILLCLAIISGVTLALFSDTERVSNHLKAGNLNITLERTLLTSTYLNDDGFLETKTDAELKDFTDNKNENVFGLDGELIVPLSRYVADMKITNRSTVAFAYWVEIVYRGGDKDDLSDLDIADQLAVLVATGDASLSEKDYVKNGVAIGSATEPVGVLGVGDSATFTVSLEFLDIEGEVRVDPDTGETTIISNNMAQNDDVYFDLVVHAVQYTGSDPSTTP